MGILSVARGLLSPPSRLAYTEARVLVEPAEGGAPRFGLSGWRDAGGGRAFQPSDAWDSVMSGGRNRRLSTSFGVSAMRERTRLDRWDGCVREGVRLAPLDALCEVELRRVMPDLHAPERIRGEAVGLRRVWLRSAPDRCDTCGGAFTLTVLPGADADYVAWSCEPRGASVAASALIEGIATRYGVTAEFD